MIDRIKLKNLAKENNQNNGLFAVIMFVFAGILVTALSFLDLVLSTLFLILIPLIVLPMMFSFQFAILHKSEVDKFSLGIFFQGFRIYFSEKFSSSFSFFKTLLVSILIYAGLLILSILIIDLPLYSTNCFGIREFIDSLNSFIYSDVTVEAFEEFISNNRETVNILSIFTSILPLSVGTFYVVYAYSRNSISIILKNDIEKYQGRYLNSLARSFVKDNKKQFYKADLILNWPFYVSFIILFGLGGYLGSLYELSLVCVYTFAFALSIFFYLAVFGSFRFSNKQAIYYYFKEELIKYDVEYQTKLIENFANKFMVSVEDKDDIEEEEDNKKDSNES